MHARTLRTALPTAALAVLVALPLAGPTPPRVTPGATADELEGLWKAKRRFGPDARGPLIIERNGAAYTADMMGRVLPVRLDNGELAFELPNGEGAFRGKPQPGGAIHGTWFPPRSAAQGGFATPVRLTAQGPNRWTGHVLPFDDVFTFYLLVRKRPDGSLGALLRNPERDFGAWLGVERLAREGNLLRLLGKRRGQTEERELARGSYDAEDSVITLVFPSRGGSYEFRRDDEQSDVYPRGKSPGRYVYHRPVARDDGWPTGTPEEVGIDRAAVERFVQLVVDMPMDSVDTPQIHSLLIARHGKLVVEEYFHGEHRDKLHDTRSAAKSVTATIVGAAMQAGAPLGLATPVYQAMNGGTFPPDLEPQKRAMTLEHLLTMSSGFFCDDQNPDAPGNEDKMWDQTDEPDYYRYTLRLPMAAAPGDTAVYCSINPNLALGVVSRATGESPLYTFERLLAGPMRITHYAWPIDPVGHPYGGGSMRFQPRDFVKFGQLMLNGGAWQGRRLLSSDFVTRASSPLVRLGGRGYGLLWWGDDYPYGDRTIPAFAALGAGGQLVMVFRDLDLVIASHGANYSSRGWRYVQWEFIPKYILPAVR